MKLQSTGKEIAWNRCVRRLGVSGGMLSVTSQRSCSVGIWIHETGGLWRALGVINILEAHKDLKLGELHNGLRGRVDERTKD